MQADCADFPGFDQRLKGDYRVTQKGLEVFQVDLNDMWKSSQDSLPVIMDYLEPNTYLQTNERYVTCRFFPS